MLCGQCLELRVIHLAGRRIQSIRHGVIDSAGEIDPGAMGQVPAFGKTHAKQSVPRLQERHVGCGVGR